MVGNTYATVLKGRKKSIDHKIAVINALGNPEVKDKISASWANKPLVKCPHCDTEGKQGHNMNRYHYHGGLNTIEEKILTIIILTLKILLSLRSEEI